MSFKGKIALAAWGLAGVFLTADFFMGTYPASGNGQYPITTVSAPEENVAPKEEKYIALTFDDGPHKVYTPKLLEGLRKRGVHATFFLIGQNIDGNEDIIRQMKEDGHLIGNHSQNHMQLTKEQTKEACDQINRTNEMIERITGETPVYVRPPFGSWSGWCCGTWIRWIGRPRTKIGSSDILSATWRTEASSCFTMSTIHPWKRRWK